MIMKKMSTGIIKKNYFSFAKQKKKFSDIKIRQHH